jgi:hypothetical protein
MARLFLSDDNPFHMNELMFSVLDILIMAQSCVMLRIKFNYLFHYHVFLICLVKISILKEL